MRVARRSKVGVRHVESEGSKQGLGADVRGERCAHEVRCQHVTSEGSGQGLGADVRGQGCTHEVGCGTCRAKVGIDGRSSCRSKRASAMLPKMGKF